MKGRCSFLLACLAVLAVPETLFASFSSLGRTTLTAVASVTEGTNFPPVSINVTSTLPGSAFFGKDAVIPVEIVSSSTDPINTANLSVAMVYQLIDASGNPIGQPITVPIAFQVEPNKPNATLGAAIIASQDLLPIRQGGQMNYFFMAQQGSQQTLLRSKSAPFQMQFVNTMSFPISPSGSIWSIPDTFLTDGKTSVSFPPGALSNAGLLVVTALDPLSVPAGPGGLQPFVVYEFDLEGTSLQTEAQLTLSYPAKEDGTLAGSNGNPQDLAPYTLQGLNWQVLGPRQTDTLLHTVSVPTTHFSKFALFLSGATSAASLRPMQRILTPNGDGINDSITFSGVTSADSVHIFDIRGRRVRTMGGPSPTWDGRDDDGRIVESGVYLYQYTSQGERVSGVILVAK